jgi:hypothetical protein
VGMGCPYSSSEHWKPLAQEVLSDNRDLTTNSIPGNFYRLLSIHGPFGVVPGHKVSW